MGFLENVLNLKTLIVEDNTSFKEMQTKASDPFSIFDIISSIYSESHCPPVYGVPLSGSCNGFKDEVMVAGHKLEC